MMSAACVCAYTSFYPHLVPTLSLMQQPSALFIPVAVQPLLRSGESAHLATPYETFFHKFLSFHLSVSLEYNNLLTSISRLNLKLLL